MSGENGAKRVREYSIPMAEGFVYNYAAKQVDDTVLATLEKLAKEAQLSEKFEELYNGAVINTGETRLVLTFPPNSMVCSSSALLLSHCGIPAWFGLPFFMNAITLSKICFSRVSVTPSTLAYGVM